MPSFVLHLDQASRFVEISVEFVDTLNKFVRFLNEIRQLSVAFCGDDGKKITCHFVMSSIHGAINKAFLLYNFGVL